MADQTLTLRIRAIDEASSVIGGLKGKMAGFGKGPAGDGGIGGGVVAGLAAGIAGAGILAGLNIMKSLISTGVSVLKRIWQTTVESSGYLKASFKLLGFALESVLRPLGDTLGRMILPNILTFVQATSKNYAEFLKAIQGASPEELPGIMADYMNQNAIALTDFLESLTGPTGPLTLFINAVSPLILSSIETLKPTILAAISSWAPAVAKALAEPFVKPAALATTGVLGLVGVKVYEYGKSLGEKWRGGGAEEATKQLTPPITANVYFNAPIYGVDDIEQAVNNALNETLKHGQTGA